MPESGVLTLVVSCLAIVAVVIVTVGARARRADGEEPRKSADTGVIKRLTVEPDALRAAQESLGRGTNDRLTRIEQMIDVIAVEMERVGEGQRFMSKLLADRSAEQNRAGGSPPAARAVTPR